MYDVMIIGAGVSGCAVARELSRRKRKIAVLERCADLCEGTSKANSGIVHAGFDAEPGSMKARMNREGSKRMEALSRELDFPYRKNGSLVLCFSEEERGRLEELMKKAAKNRIEGCRILTGEEVRAMEPQISGEVTAALYAPEGGIVCPFGLTTALAENACANGVEFYFGQEVTAIRRLDPGYEIVTPKAKWRTRLVVNAAGVYADRIHNMAAGEEFCITPRKGEYCLMDRSVGDFVSHTIFQLPDDRGKGVLVTPTVHGNLLAGPTANDIEDREATNTTEEKTAELIRKAMRSTPNLPIRQTITGFAGLRAVSSEHDFIIREAKDAPGFIDVAGMESPGLSSAPAVGCYVAELIQNICPAEEKFETER